MIDPPRRVVVLGTGSAAHYLIDLCADLGVELYGFLDNNRTPGELLFAIPVLGGDELLRDKELVSSVDFIVAIGDNFERRKLIAKVTGAGGVFTTLIHPSCIISSFASIGTGTVLNALTSVRIGAEVGTHVLCEGHTRIGYRNHVGDNTVIASGVVFSADTRIGSDCFIGAGANVLPRTEIGDRCFIGAGALVTKPVPDGYLAYGAPAENIRKSSIESAFESI